MKVVQGILFFLIAELSVASPVIQRVELTPENTHELGFAVRFEVEPEATIVTLVGPKYFDECLPGRSGVALLDLEGNEIMVSQTHLTHHGEVSPTTYASFFSPQSQVLSVWLDYYCTPDSDSRRYIVPSASDYLITSQGSKGASRAGTP